MVVNPLDPLGNGDSDDVPAELRRVVGIEVILCVSALAAAVLNDVLLGVANDDGEILVLFYALLRDRVDGTSTTLAVGREDPIDNLRGELAGVFKRRLPLLNRVHGAGFSAGVQKGFGDESATRNADIGAVPTWHHFLRRRYNDSVTRPTFVMLIRAARLAVGMQEQAASVGADELATLKELALSGGLDGSITVTCATLADRLGASNQTASRRLQRLEEAETIDRELLGDGQRVQITDTGERVLRGEYEAYRRIFEREAAVELNGVVTSGMGEGRHYISLSGYMEQFRDRLGYEPFAGTLNVDLDAESVDVRARVDALEPVRIDGWEDDDRTYGPAFCWPATVHVDAAAYERAHVIAPERTHHGADQLEVIAPDKLRETLALNDGQEVTVRVTQQ